MSTEVQLKEFIKGTWNVTVDPADFVQKNIKPYDGDASFLEGPTDRTLRVWKAAQLALREERINNGCRAIDTEIISSITSHRPGYIKKDDEVIVGLQTDEILKRAMKPFGGIKLVQSAVEERGLEVSARVIDIFKYARSHNQAVFNAYDSEVRAYRSNHVLTGLPDNYGRGRIIGDFRRMALYGASQLIEAKKMDLTHVSTCLEK
jgi:formate C-acetyltransferase